MLISKQDFKKQQIVLAAAIFVGLTIYLIGFIILLSALLILQNSKKKNDFHNNLHEQHRCFCLGIGGGWVLEYLHGSIYITMGV